MREPPGVDRIGLRILAVVPEPALDPHGGLVDLARGADQLQQHLAVVAAQLLGEFGHEALHGEGARHVVDRAPPADPGMGLGRTVLAADRGDVEWQVRMAHPVLEGAEKASSGAKVETMEGATTRCIHPVTLPFASTAASIRSTEVEW